MADTRETRVIRALLERLYSSLARGPAINCAPGNSRQRLDIALLTAFQDAAPGDVLARVLGDETRCRIRLPSEKLPPLPPEEPEDPEEKKIYDDLRRRYREQQEKSRLLQKLATIADDARTYELDTGAYILYIGYPLLSIAPGEGKGRSSRVLAPLAFVPVHVSVGRGTSPFVEFSCAEEGSERIIPNAALRVWLEHQSGRSLSAAFEDNEETDPLREITDLTAHVAAALEITEIPSLEGWPVSAVPKADQLPSRPAILPAAVLGLYRLDYQNTIADLEALEREETVPPTVRPFLTLNESLVQDETPSVADADAPLPDAVAHSLNDDHLVTHADPCQRRAVAHARTARGLVVHGPPGTGKSQTITNIIGDALARDQRVLFVCEKRTALDVVKHRLDHLGIGSLCAIVHDATRDRATLYKDVREQLDNLSGSAPESDPTRELNRAVNEMKTASGELKDYFDALAAGDESSPLSFGELTARWFESFALIGRERLVDLHPDLGSFAFELLLEREGEMRGVLARMERCAYADNSWAAVHGTSLSDFISRHMHTLRADLQRCADRARDAADRRVPDLPGYNVDTDLITQGTLRADAGARLKQLVSASEPAVRSALASLDPQQLRQAGQQMEQLASSRQQVAAAVPDTELSLVFNAAPWPLPQVGSAVADLENWLLKSRSFFGFLAFGARKKATAVLMPLGLPLTQENATRARDFLQTARARMLLRSVLTQHPGEAALPPSSDDASLLRAWDGTAATIAFLTFISDTPSLVPLTDAVRGALPDPAAATALAASLERCPEEARAFSALLDELHKLSLMSPDALQRMREKLLFGKPLADDIEKLRTDAEQLEELLRFESEARQFPAPVADSLLRLARADVAPDDAWHQLLVGIISGTLHARLRRHPVLHGTDPQKLSAHFQRLRELTLIRHDLESRSIRHRWQSRQRERLLASTGSRLNSDGADLRRRLTLRGRNASRIRQILIQGRSIPGGDPIYDLKPIWMASPETVAQIFPLEPIFDIVVFDEASQCRLEHGLSVLARGERVCIAGDTKQLPPTRFFDSTVTASADSAADDDDSEELFVSQQSEIEDLLGAALNIEVEQSYLDVHYRSTSSDLIHFSNDSFYGSRLQAIPGHPNNRRDEPAVQLHNVGGTYIDRQNPAEADYVVTLVKGLLRRADPPSIGIVTFNLQQKDLITRKLDEEAETDAEFRRVLSIARERQGDGSFEGLFVKNLENVQGDERDYIILSTTYGPDNRGKFYRRFGPLAQSGGERRLNVIITRARDQVELVTSIPSEIYRAEAVVPDGKRPNGSWYLMGYLRYAELLRDVYAKGRERRLREETAASNQPAVVELAGPAPPSPVAQALAEHLRSARGTSSWLSYGTEGFCVDVAFRHPVRTKDATVGVLCDGTRYARAHDPVEWDNFQSAILESQNWNLHRIWSPHFFRDPEGTLAHLGEEIEKSIRIQNPEGKALPEER